MKKPYGIAERILMIFFGYCEMNVKSHPEKALSILLLRRAKFTHMRNTSEGISFRIFLFAKNNIYSELKAEGIEFSLGESGGLPVLLKKLSKRHGLLLGLLAMLTLSILSEQFIWELKISGNQKLNSSEIISDLSEYGVHVGARISSLDLDGICADYLIKNKNISWIRINMIGNSAQIVLKEKSTAAKDESSGPSNLIASCDGYIFRIELRGGQALVAHGEAVLKGQTLVSGLVGNENETCRFEHADAKVFAVTNETITVKTPMIYSEKRYTGEIREKNSLIFFSKSINFSILGRNSDTSCDIIDVYNYLELPNGKVLPVSVKTSYIKEYTIESVPLSESDALRIANEELAEKISALLGDEGTLLSQNIKISYDKKYCTLTCDLSCIRDIAKEIPMFTGSSN